jgi:hypothetical protein
MSRIVAVLGVLWATAAFGAEPAAVRPGSSSSLVRDGALQTVKASLAQICRFKIEAGKLQLDRDSWQRAAEKYDKEHPAEEEGIRPLDPNFAARHPKIAARQQQRQQQQLARQKEWLARTGPVPPLHTLFRQLRNEARQVKSNASSGAGPSHRGDGEWSSFFANDFLVANLHTFKDFDFLTVEELQPPWRTFELSVTQSDPTFRIRLSNPDGELLMLSQDAIGHVSIIEISQQEVFVAQAESFPAFFKQQRRRTDAKILAALAQVGIDFLAPTDAPAVRQAVSKLLLRSPEASADGRQLLIDLDGPVEATHLRAARLLRGYYESQRDLIHQKYQAAATSDAARNVLREIIGEQTDSPQVGDTIGLLDLVNDPAYLAELLDDADPREYVTVLRRLETRTGQKLGTEASAWKAWAAAKVAPIAHPEPPTDWRGAALLADGSLQTLREPLADVFAFTLTGGQLLIDHAAWHRSAFDFESISPEEDRMKTPKGVWDDPQGAAAFFAIKGLFKLIEFDRGPTPAITTLFRKIQAHAGTQSSSSGGGGTGDNARWDASFNNKALSGQIHATQRSGLLTLHEKQPTGRLFHFRMFQDFDFDIQVSNSRGELVSLQSTPGGRCTMVAMLAGKPFAAQGKSFVDLFKQHRSLMESEILPALARFGCRPILSPSDAMVRSAALATILNSPETIAAGDRLIAELDHDDFEAREKASAELTRRYIVYRDLIHDRLRDPANSAETAARLKRIVMDCSDWKLVSATIAALDLTRDAPYVVSLFGEAKADDRAKIAEHLEMLTGKRLGVDPTAWKTWLREQDSSNNLAPRSSH